MKRIAISTEGLPLVILMQLEELTGKVDMMMEILKRIEVRLIRMEPQPEEEPMQVEVRQPNFSK